MGMDPVLLVPKRERGSRTFNGTSQTATAPVRAMGINDITVCGWVYPQDVDESSTHCILRSYTTTGGVWVGARGTTLGVYARVGADISGDQSSAGVIAAGEWNFIVVLFDRSGNAVGYVNNMSSSVVTADISGAVAQDWGNGLDPWRVGRDGVHTTDYLSGRLSRIGVVIGSLLDEDDRNELYNSGRGIRYAQMSSGLVAKFASQDYWDFWERSGNMANAATALRPLTAVAAPGYAGAPKR